MNKKERIEIRVTLIEKRIIEKLAKKSGIKPSEYVRKSALEKVIKTKFSEEEMVLLKMLFDIGLELKKLKTDNQEEVNTIISKLKNLIEQFYDR